MYRMGWAQLFTPIGMLLCTDERVPVTCNAWIDQIPDMKPLCVLCEQEWSDKRTAIGGDKTAIGAFFVFHVHDTEFMTVSAVCNACCDLHGDETQSKCYEVLRQVYPDANLQVLSKGTETKQ